MSKGSSVSVWLLNKLFNMETIIQNQGLQHIVEKSLLCLDKKSIDSFRLVNHDCKGITDSRRFFQIILKKWWKKLIQASLVISILFCIDNSSKILFGNSKLHSKREFCHSLNNFSSISISLFFLITIQFPLYTWT